MRSGWSLLEGAFGSVSSASSSVGPLYQGVSLRPWSARFTPAIAEMGMNCRGLTAPTAARVLTQVASQGVGAIVAGRVAAAVGAAVAGRVAAGVRCCTR